MRKVIILTLIFVLFIPFFNSRKSALAANFLGAGAGPKVGPQLQANLDSLQPGEMLTVIVTLTQQADLSRIGGPNPAARQRGVIRALQATANATQGPINSLLHSRQSQGLVDRFDSL